MPIFVKNSELNTETINSINNLINLDINASIAFKLSRIFKDLSSIIDSKLLIERKIMDKYSEKDENGNLVKPKDNDGNIIEGAVNILDMNKFTTEMNDLMNTVNELPYDKINFDDLKLSTTKIYDILKLDFLFK